MTPNMRNYKSLLKKILPKKTKNLPKQPYLVSGSFIKVFYQTTFDWPQE